MILVRNRIAGATCVVGSLQCPRCGSAPAYHEVYGIARLRCEGKRCRASWTAVRLPPGAPPDVVADVFGAEVAAALGPLAGPVAATEPIYAQRAPDVPEPIMSWRRAHTILASLMPE